MRKIKYVVVVALFLAVFAGSAHIASAQTSSSTQALVNQIQLLLQQVKTLQDQITALDNQRGQLSTQLQQTLRLTKSLSVGMTSDEVKLLQEMLAADPDVYPEGLVTGYFGSLTEKAVKKFQAKFGIEQLGNVGPKTMSKINTLLQQGVSSAGKLPPGFAKKLTAASTTNISATGESKVVICHKPVGNPANGQTITVGSPAVVAHLAHGDSLGACTGGSVNPTTPDTTAPVISNLVAAGTSSTTASVSWTTNENTTSTMWYSNVTPVSTTTATKLENTALKTSHTYSLTGLTATTTYYYVIKVVDAAANSAASTEHYFITLDN